MVTLNVAERPLMYEGSAIRYVDIGGGDPRMGTELGMMGLRLNRMMSEDIASYDILDRISETVTCIFGALPITPDEILKQLQALAKQLKVDASPTERTEAVNGLLHKLGKERGHELYYKGQPEFLLDFVWWEKVNGKEGSALGMESEWGSPAEVEADFSKLLSYKAPLKVMVYGSGGNAELQGEVQQRVRDLIAKFSQHVAGEVYLLIDFRPGDGCHGRKCILGKSGLQLDLDAAVDAALDDSSKIAFVSMS